VFALLSARCIIRFPEGIVMMPDDNVLLTLSVFENNIHEHQIVPVIVQTPSIANFGW
jgi:hypothetical protein